MVLVLGTLLNNGLEGSQNSCFLQSEKKFQRYELSSSYPETKRNGIVEIWSVLLFSFQYCVFYSRNPRVTERGTLITWVVVSDMTSTARFLSKLKGLTIVVLRINADFCYRGGKKKRNLFMINFTQTSRGFLKVTLSS